MHLAAAKSLLRRHETLFSPFLFSYSSPPLQPVKLIKIIITHSHLLTPNWVPNWAKCHWKAGGDIIINFFFAHPLTSWLIALPTFSHLRNWWRGRKSPRKSEPSGMCQTSWRNQNGKYFLSSALCHGFISLIALSICVPRVTHSRFEWAGVSFG